PHRTRWSLGEGGQGRTDVSGPNPGGGASAGRRPLAGSGRSLRVRRWARQGGLWVLGTVGWAELHALGRLPRARRPGRGLRLQLVLASPLVRLPLVHGRHGTWSGHDQLGAVAAAEALDEVLSGAPDPASPGHQPLAAG